MDGTLNRLLVNRSGPLDKSQDGSFEVRSSVDGGLEEDELVSGFDGALAESILGISIFSVDNSPFSVLLGPNSAVLCVRCKSRSNLPRLGKKKDYTNYILVQLEVNNKHG